LLRELEDKGLLQDSQNGFRPGRNCSDHVLTLQQVLLGRMRGKKSTYLLETDFFKAYDTVSRDGLFFRLWEAGVRGKMWRVIRDMYANTTSVAVHNGRASPAEGFQIDLGLAQGDPLSTTLYLVYINPLLEELAKRPGVALGEGNTLSSLAYADDNIAVAESAEELNAIIKVIQDYCCKWRIRVNQDKCKVLVVGPDFKKCKDKHSKDKLVWKWGGHSLPLVEQTKYLGTILHHSLSTDAHFAYVLEKASDKARKLTSVLSNKRVNVELKVLLLKTIILPILDYGSDVLTPCAKMALELQRFWTGLQRKLVAAPTTTGRLVGAELGFSTLQAGRDQRRLGYARRLHTMDNARLPQIATSVKWESVGPGAKKQLWGEQMASTLTRLDMEADFVGKNAQVSKKAFGQMVKDLLLANNTELLQEEAEKKSTVANYLQLTARPNYPAKQIQPYLKGGRTLGKSLLLQCRCHSLPLACRTCKWETTGRTRASTGADCSTPGHCTMCQTGTQETDAHFVLLCPAYEAIAQGKGRDHLKRELAQLLGPQRFGLWEAEAPETQLQQLLGYHWGEESLGVHKLLMGFLEAAWSHRTEGGREAELAGGSPPGGDGTGGPPPLTVAGGDRERNTRQVATGGRRLTGIPGRLGSTPRRSPVSLNEHQFAACVQAMPGERINRGGERFFGSGFLSSGPTGTSSVVSEIGRTTSELVSSSAPFHGGRVVNGSSATARP
jgi:hypothetical protein